MQIMVIIYVNSLALIQTGDLYTSPHSDPTLETHVLGVNIRTVAQSTLPSLPLSRRRQCAEGRRNWQNLIQLYHFPAALFALSFPLGK